MTVIRTFKEPEKWACNGALGILVHLSAPICRPPHKYTNTGGGGLVAERTWHMAVFDKLHAWKKGSDMHDLQLEATKKDSIPSKNPRYLTFLRGRCRNRINSIVFKEDFVLHNPALSIQIQEFVRYCTP